MKTPLTLIILLLLTLSSTAGTFRQFPEQQMSLVIPSGFTELKGEKVPAGALAFYMSGDPDDGKAHTVISIEMMRGSIGPDSQAEPRGQADFR